MTKEVPFYSATVHDETSGVTFYMEFRAMNKKQAKIFLDALIRRESGHHYTIKGISKIY